MGTKLAQDNKFIKSLILNAQYGNNAAFEQLYQINVESIYALSLKLTGNKSPAENLTKKVFVEGWQKISTVKDDVSFLSWLTDLTISIFNEEFENKESEAPSDRNIASEEFPEKVKPEKDIWKEIFNEIHDIKFKKIEEEEQIQVELEAIETEEEKEAKIEKENLKKIEKKKIKKEKREELTKKLFESLKKPKNKIIFALGI